MRSPVHVILGAAFTVTVMGCGGNDVCNVAANTGCDNGLVCEQAAAGGDPVCVEPVVVRGKVFKITDASAIAGARVVAIDVNGTPVSSVATTDTSGNYELGIPSTRDTNGKPVGATLTLRVDAQGFVTFPAGIRPALPISTANPVETSGKLVISSTLTSLGLIAQPGGSGGNIITGKVDVPASRAGVLVIAETGAGTGGISAVADVNGDYKIFNVPSGTWTVKAYARGVNYDPGTTTLGGSDTKTVDLHINAAKAASNVTGTVQIVATTGQTSVILVVESTFNDALVRGETPPGLRAPPPPTAPNVTGAWTIAGVPEGKYVVLAGFENDSLVRDTSAIGGTAIVHITVTSGADTAAGAFKVTAATAIVGPGADAPESLTVAPTLSWTSVPSADRYHVSVFDALGSKVWEADTVKPTAQVAYAGPFVSGMYYQFMVETRKDTAPSGYQVISKSEDLRGVFFKP